MLSVLFLRRMQIKQGEMWLKQRYCEFACIPIEEIKAIKLINYCSDIKSDKKEVVKLTISFIFCSESNSDI